MSLQAKLEELRSLMERRLISEDEYAEFKRKALEQGLEVEPALEGPEGRPASSEGRDEVPAPSSTVPEDTSRQPDFEWPKGRRLHAAWAAGVLLLSVSLPWFVVADGWTVASGLLDKGQVLYGVGIYLTCVGSCVVLWQIATGRPVAAWWALVGAIPWVLLFFALVHLRPILQLGSGSMRVVAEATRIGVVAHLLAGGALVYFSWAPSRSGSRKQDAGAQGQFQVALPPCWNCGGEVEPDEAGRLGHYCSSNCRSEAVARAERLRRKLKVAAWGLVVVTALGTALLFFLNRDLHEGIDARPTRTSVELSEVPGPSQGRQAPGEDGRELSSAGAAGAVEARSTRARAVERHEPTNAGAAAAVAAGHSRAHTGQRDVDGYELCSRLVKSWARAQNDSDFAAYAKHYAEDFRGTKLTTSGKRTEYETRGDWLADRLSMFKSRFQVDYDQLRVGGWSQEGKVASGRCEVRQYWWSRRYADQCNKVLHVRVATTAGPGQIHREECTWTDSWTPSARLKRRVR